MEQGIWSNQRTNKLCQSSPLNYFTRPRGILKLANKLASSKKIVHKSNYCYFKQSDWFAIPLCLTTIKLLFLIIWIICRSTLMPYLLCILAWLVIWSLFFSVIRPSSDSDSLNSFHPFIELNSVQTARLLRVLRLYWGNIPSYRWYTVNGDIFWMNNNELKITRDFVTRSWFHLNLVFYQKIIKSGNFWKYKAAFSDLL